MKNKKILALILAIIVLSSITMTSCSKKSSGDEVSEVSESETVDMPETTEDVTQSKFVYGMAGDMFNEFVANVSIGNFDSAKNMVAFSDKNAIIGETDIEQYLMSLSIGNLLFMDYTTANITYSDSGAVRECTFEYYDVPIEMVTEESTIKSFVMNIRLEGTEWKVDLSDMLLHDAYLILPDIGYKSITIDNYNLNVNDYTSTENGVKIYKLPAVSIYDHTITIINSSGETYSKTLNWNNDIDEYSYTVDDEEYRIDGLLNIISWNETGFSKSSNNDANQPVQNNDAEKQPGIVIIS